MTKPTKTAPEDYKEPVHRKRKPKKKSDQWEILYQLIGDFIGWARADEMKGGGDPEGVREIELSLELAEARLQRHIARMRRGDFDAIN